MEIYPLSFDVNDIMTCQQNRYPMLFIDRVTECVPLKYAKGFKLFSNNEWYFHGCEAAMPEVWGVIQIEAMSQMFLMTFLVQNEFRGLVTASNRFNKVEFLRKIIPGERLDLEASLESFGRGVARGRVRGEVNGILACSMECTIVVPELFGNFQKTLNSNEVSKSIANFAEGDQINLSIEKIRDFLLIKYPWFLLDGAIEIRPGKFAKTIKNFTYNEHYFPTHFPGAPNVPGFIQIECCIQSFLLTFLSLDQYKRRETTVRMLNNVHLGRKIIPGDVLEMHASLDSFSYGIAKGRVDSYVNGEQAISLEITAVVVDELEKFRPKLKG